MREVFSLFIAARDEGVVFKSMCSGGALSKIY